MKGRHHLLMQLRTGNRRGLFLLNASSSLFNQLWLQNSMPRWATVVFKYKNHRAAPQERGYFKYCNFLVSIKSVHLEWHRLICIKYSLDKNINKYPQISDYYKVSIKYFNLKTHKETVSWLFKNYKVGNNYTNFL